MRPTDSSRLSSRGRVVLHTWTMPKLSSAPLEPPQRRRVALVAHDNKKPDLLDWVEFNRGTLEALDLIATGTTGKMIEERTGLRSTLLLSGPLGGDQQLGARIAEGGVDVLIFFWDPLEPQPHDPDVKALLRIAAVWNIAVACNRATADYIISSPLFANRYAANLPNFDDHSRRLLPTPAAPQKSKLHREKASHGER